MRFVLASGSPRRRELMEMLGVKELAVIPARGEERADLSLPFLISESVSRAVK